MAAERRAAPAKALLMRRLSRDGRQFSGMRASLANFFLEDYQKAAFMTATEVAEHIGTSISTVIRFAASLGYDGYPALRRALHQIVQQDLTGTDLFVRHLRRREPNLLDSLVRREIENLSRLAKEVAVEELDRLATLLARAERVFVVGMRASSALASYFGYHLAKVYDPVVTITAETEGVFDRLAVAGAADVLVAIAFPRYPRATVEIADFARREGLFVAAITDSVLSPLAKRANLVLPVRAEVVSYVDSFCGPHVLLTALLVQTSVKNQAKTEARLGRFEAIAERQRLFHSGA